MWARLGVATWLLVVFVVVQAAWDGCVRRRRDFDDPQQVDERLQTITLHVAADNGAMIHGNGVYPMMSRRATRLVRVMVLPPRRPSSLMRHMCTGAACPIRPDHQCSRSCMPTKFTPNSS
jgi:hypothetical protein